MPFREFLASLLKLNKYIRLPFYYGRGLDIQNYRPTTGRIIEAWQTRSRDHKYPIEIVPGSGLRKAFHFHWEGRLNTLFSDGGIFDRGHVPHYLALHILRNHEFEGLDQHG